MVFTYILTDQLQTSSANFSIKIFDFFNHKILLKQTITQKYGVKMFKSCMSNYRTIASVMFKVNCYVNVY